MDNHVNAVTKSIHYHIRALRHIRSFIFEDMAKMVAPSSVPAWTTPTLSYMAPLRKTSLNFRHHRTSSHVSSLVHLVLLSLAHIIFSNTFTGSPTNIASTSKYPTSPFALFSRLSLFTLHLAYASFYSFPQALKHQFVMRSIRSYFIWLPQFQCCSS